jgi:hypothetical protein
MFIMDVPNIPQQETPVVMVQVADSSLQADYLLKTCDEVSSAATVVIDSAGWLIGEVMKPIGPQSLSQTELMLLVASVKLIQLKGTTHGKLIPSSIDGRVVYEYRSEPSYVGKDHAIFMAEFKGKHYRIEANVVVLKSINDNDPQCHEPTLSKATKYSSGASSYGSGYNLASVFISYKPNPAVKRDAPPKSAAPRPLPLR